MLIEPHVHESFVREFGINMLNTLTAKENRLVAHRRRIYVFDERGGVFGGELDGDQGTLQAYENLTTGVFHSRQRRVVGVRYRCRPNALEVSEIGAFHTHPALFSTNVRQVRARTERLLWMSEMDRKAFLKQHELYGYRWHFIGSMDLGCFHIDDVLAGQYGPREILRYPKLEEAIAELEPQVRFYDRILNSAPVRNPSGEVLSQMVQSLTRSEEPLEAILLNSESERIPPLAEQVASQCQLLGFSQKQVLTLLRRSLGEDPQLEGTSLHFFRTHVLDSYTKLSALSS